MDPIQISDQFRVSLDRRFWQSPRLIRLPIPVCRHVAGTPTVRRSIKPHSSRIRSNWTLHTRTATTTSVIANTNNKAIRKSNSIGPSCHRTLKSIKLNLVGFRSVSRPRLKRSTIDKDPLITHRSLSGYVLHQKTLRYPYTPRYFMHCQSLQVLSQSLPWIVFDRSRS